MHSSRGSDFPRRAISNSVKNLRATQTTEQVERTNQPVKIPPSRMGKKGKETEKAQRDVQGFY
jgi:hypothetical protein